MNDKKNTLQQFRLSEAQSKKSKDNSKRNNNNSWEDTMLNNFQMEEDFKRGSLKFKRKNKHKAKQVKNNRDDSTLWDLWNDDI
ncbi:hypothetical protein RclHR1_00930019 [Rhizophagus clarus]|uniref:Uncharacterized protein n=1 Tax=Rhizophagus clarus TaxID=94130 RepID=A0A2Z6S682_9GLOM|nr:hypothetical protein RclHR1_00930019 [Rhizophagus clarus]GES73808.1 hypothetical protein GLOIN_2v1840059 [Rhizophagus clarus]